jgi:hypothetical protein
VDGFMNDFRYHLRFCVQPGYFEEEKLRDLLLFCDKAGIDEVVFFINPEELNQGHLTVDQTDVWLGVIKRFAGELKKHGVAFSVNPWSTLGHADRGRTLDTGVDFGLMTDINGRNSTAVACPLSQDFADYLCGIYARVAELEPRILWIEDDFRLHNHVPLEWGGCFCDEHMSLFSQKLGYSISREEFIKRALQPGEPDKCRKALLDVSRQSLTELARKITQAVQAVSDSVRMGIMSSIPSVHCAEARDWKVLFDAVSIDGSAYSRPHMPAYSNRVPGEYMFDFNTTTLGTAVNLPAYAHVLPELESIPHTLYSKSKAFTRFQMENSLLAGAKGITLNIFDMMGNGVDFEAGYHEVLAAAKPFLKEAAALGLSAKNMRGIRVLYSPDSSYALHTRNGKQMQELYPADVWMAGALGCFSIPVSYELSPDSPDDRPIAVSGQTFRNLQSGRIESLLKSRCVILDGEAVETLFMMNLHGLLGIRDVEMIPCESNYVTMETVVSDNFTALKGKRMTMQGAIGPFVKITYDRQPDIITMASNNQGQPVTPATTVINGNILVIPYGCFSTETYALFYGSRSIFNPVRRQIISGFLETHAADVPHIKDSPYVYCYHFVKERKECLAVVNASLDDYSDIRIHWQNAGSCPYRIVQRPGGNMKCSVSGNEVALDGTLHSMEMILLAADIERQEKLC